MTVRACIIGHPVSQSRSPLIHGHWLRRHGVDGAYDRADVAPEALEGFLATLAERGYAGGNVTVPHKARAFALAEVDDPVAERLEAVNLLWLEAGRLRGANTDVAGFLANLDAEAPGWDRDPGPAAVLGAGGGARAVIHALLERGFGPVRVLNRTADRAGDLARRFGPAVRPQPLAETGRALSDATILVNTTSLGMTGQPPLALDLGPLPERALVTDLVYAPLETGLLAAARRRGLRAVDGLGMLLHQAVPAFERWFGVRPTVTPELRALVEADLAAPAGERSR